MIYLNWFSALDLTLWKIFKNTNWNWVIIWLLFIWLFRQTVNNFTFYTFRFCSIVFGFNEILGGNVERFGTAFWFCVRRLWQMYVGIQTRILNQKILNRLQLLNSNSQISPKPPKTITKYKSSSFKIIGFNFQIVIFLMNSLIINLSGKLAINYWNWDNEHFPDIVIHKVIF